MASLTTSLVNATNDTSEAATVREVLSGAQLCRDRLGYHHTSIYNVVTCSYCFLYVFAEYNVTLDFKTYGLVTKKNTVYPEGTRLDTNVNNSVSVSMVCGLLKDPSECWKWQECCRQARACCQRQMRDNLNPTKDNMCPATWDGYYCWPETNAGQQPAVQCPPYVPGANTARYAYKTCTSNATWHVNPTSRKEWTDYTDCFNKARHHRLYTAGLVCNTITIALLIPACIIFLYYRPLRQQDRIRLHLCLMASSCLTSVCLLLWEVLVFKDHLESSKSLQNTAFNNAIGCRLLIVLTRYAEMASFMWMFIEGFHLHRLLVRAFSIPKTIFPYYIFGFGFPLLPVTAYSLIRGSHQELNQKCWIERAGAYEWILAVPSITVLAVNVVFLLRIVFIMVRQLEPHRNEPSNFRRAVKAVLVLVPLFGLQFLLFIYRPDVTGNFHQAFELISKICSSLQGSVVAMVFCYFNKEVQGYLKTSCMRSFRRKGRQDHQSCSLTLSSQLQAAESSRTRKWNESGESHHMISLQADDHCCLSSIDDKKTERLVKNGDMSMISESMEGEYLLHPK